MFLDQKKGNLTAEQIIKILIAVVLIFVIFALTYSIWNALFPSADKSSIKSFDTMYSLLMAKSESKASYYDSTKINLYLKSGLVIVFFDNGVMDCSIQYPDSTGKDLKLPEPKACGKSSQCICLYEGISFKDKNIAKCYPLEKPISIDPKHFDINSNICTLTDVDKIYNNYIFAKRYDPDTQKNYIYVLRDTDANEALDTEWKKPICHSDKTDGLCKDKPDQTIITFGTDEGINKMFDYCQKKDSKYKTNIIQCVYDETSDSCDADCSYGDVSSRCGTTYQSCSDINEDPGVIKFIDTQYSYKNKVLCENSRKYCSNLKPCQISNREIYSCKDASSISGSANANGAKCLPPSDLKNRDGTAADCKTVFSSELSDNHIGLFIESYDTNIDACKKYMDDNFYIPVSLMTCRKNMLYDCEKFIKNADNVKNCQLKYVNRGDYYSLTHYDTSQAGCADIDKYFIKEQFCDTTSATP